MRLFVIIKVLKIKEKKGFYTLSGGFYLHGRKILKIRLHHLSMLNIGAELLIGAKEYSIDNDFLELHERNVTIQHLR